MKTLTPNDIHALPTLRSLPWYDADLYAGEFFDDETILDRIDLAKAAASGFEGAVFHTKLERVIDEDSSVEYVTATLNDVLIGMLVYARSSSDRIVTDIDGWRTARNHAVSLVPYDVQALRDATGADTPIERLRGRDGVLLTEVGGETRLVDVDHVDETGRVLLDDRLLRKAFDRIVRPEVGNDPMRRDWRGDDAIRALACRCVVESLYGELRHTILDHRMPEAPGKVRKVDWVAVVLANDEGTYVVGTAPYGSSGAFGWLDGLRAVRLGGPELYEGIRSKHVEPETEEVMPTFPGP